MFPAPTDYADISSIIKTIRNTCAGWDDIPTRVVKSAFEPCLEPLTHIYNHSFLPGIVPNVLKVAKVIESGKFVLGVFFDFSNAFDTVNYHIYYKRYMPMVLVSDK